MRAEEAQKTTWEQARSKNFGDLKRENTLKQIPQHNLRGGEKIKRPAWFRRGKKGPQTKQNENKKKKKNKQYFKAQGPEAIKKTERKKKP